MAKPYKIILYNNGKKIKTFAVAKTYNESVKVYNEILKENKNLIQHIEAT